MQQQVIDEFRARGGRVGGYFAGVPLLLLHAVGARTGRQLTTPLAYLADEDRFVIVAANAGAPRHLGWYGNLHAQPHVTVEVGTAMLDATAVVESGERRETLFRRFAAQSPQLLTYQARAARLVPIVTLVRRRPGAGASEPAADGHEYVADQR
jgi:deazaflavin-dependent oxidoreductase (nitroreductase family)